MKVAVFNAKSYDKKFLDEANKEFGHHLVYLEPHLNKETMKLAYGFPCVCVFVNDQLNKTTMTALSKQGTKLIALRCAGFNNVDLNVAAELSIPVVRVPVYSPHGVAEHAVALILSLNRKICRATYRVREGNFSLEGLLGFELHGQTVGIIGTGKIGCVLAQIMTGFQTKVIAYDPYPNDHCRKMGVEYVSLVELFEKSDIISLHAPLTPENYHLINEESIKQMKKGVMLINTSRGGLIDTRAVIKGLKSRKIGFLGLDVYEEEETFFFEDYSDQLINDDVFARLLTFSNVLITGHQAFFTDEALRKIAETTLKNITAFEEGRIILENCVSLDIVQKVESKVS